MTALELFVSQIQPTISFRTDVPLDANVFAIWDGHSLAVVPPDLASNSGEREGVCATSTVENERIYI